MLSFVKLKFMAMPQKIDDLLIVRYFIYLFTYLFTDLFLVLFIYLFKILIDFCFRRNPLFKIKCSLTRAKLVPYFSKLNWH